MGEVRRTWLVRADHGGEIDKAKPADRERLIHMWGAGEDSAATPPPPLWLRPPRMPYAPDQGVSHVRGPLRRRRQS
jgi:hypothetical protein